MEEACLITVDGFDGSGKSTLARGLARESPGVHVELDEFLVKNQGGYLRFLRYGDLSGHLRAAVERRRCWIILEGVCVKEVLSRVGRSECASVYVKRLVSGFWSDGSILHQAASAEEAIAHEEESTRKYCEWFLTNGGWRCGGLR